MWSEQLAAAEEALSSRDAQMRGVEAKVESYVEKVSVLQVEKERLTQQVGSHSSVHISIQQSVHSTIYSILPVSIPFLQVEFGKRKLEETSNAVLQAQNRFDQLLQSVRGDQHKIGSLEESLGGITGDRKAWQERATNLEVELAQHQDTVRQTEQGKQVLMEEKVVLKGEVSRLEAQVRVQTAEMEAEVAKKKDLVRELEHLSEVGVVISCVCMCVCIHEGYVCVCMCRYEGTYVCMCYVVYGICMCVDTRDAGRFSVDETRGNAEAAA